MSKNNRLESQYEKDQEMRQVHHSVDAHTTEINKIEHQYDHRRRRYRCCIPVEQRIVQEEDRNTKVREAQFFRAQRNARDINFATELQRVMDETLLEEKKRQHLRVTSEELRDLEGKLRTAYCVKELDAQRLEKNLSVVKKMNQEARLNELVRGSWEKQKVEDQKLEHEELMLKIQYGDELKAQMVSEATKRELLYQEFLRERRLLDEAVQKINDEDHKAELEKMKKLEKTRQEIEEFIRAQVTWRNKQQLELEEEHSRIMDYLKMRDIEDQKRMKEQRLRERTKAEVSEIVACQIYETEIKKKERDAILQAVAEEERWAKQEHRYREEIERKIRLQVEANNSYRQQIEEIKERLLREANQEKVVRQEMLERIAEDSRVEQMTKDKKRLKMIQVRREVEEAMEEKRLQRAEELQHIARMEKLWEKDENTRRGMIEEERLRMLKEHASKLLGYIPFGVLRESDLPLLGPEFVEMYGSKQGKGLTNPNVA